jgi:hypothetical protein
MSRHVASRPPRINPCSAMTTRAYSEHVGANRHARGSHGEMTC